MRKIIFILFFFSILFPVKAFAFPQIVETNFELPVFYAKDMFTDKPLSNEHIKGQVSIFIATASWCQPCHRQHPILVEIAKKYDLKLYAIAMKSKKKDLVKLYEEYGNPFQFVANDSSGKLRRLFSVPEEYATEKVTNMYIPSMYILDQNGIIRYVREIPLHEGDFEKYVLPKINELKNAN